MFFFIAAPFFAVCCNLLPADYANMIPQTPLPVNCRGQQ
jgi:hypothetical protein